jgi:hypothetical protein
MGFTGQYSWFCHHLSGYGHLILWSVGSQATIRQDYNKELSMTGEAGPSVTRSAKSTPRARLVTVVARQLIQALATFWWHKLNWYVTDAI